MSDSPVLNMHIDGAARGNPGPAAYAYVIHRPGAAPVEAKGTLGSATNNVAEYTALVRALERAATLGADRLIVHSDSELLVKQMNGEYRVKNESLRELFEQAKRLCDKFSMVTLRHVPRAENKRADQLCNEALDGAMEPRPSSARPGKSGASRAADGGAREEAVREEALACLRAAAACWARGQANVPPPEQVWEQLWSVLEENGVLRRP